MHKIVNLCNILTLFTQSKLNKSIVNLYQNELLGHFPEVIKIWPALTFELLTDLYQCLFFDILSNIYIYVCVCVLKI